MSRENKETLDVYEELGDRYLERNATTMAGDSRLAEENKENQKFLELSLKGLPKTAKIFEIGSAGGRDMKHIRSLGYSNIMTSDAVERFIKILRDEGFPVKKFDLITDDFDEAYDYVLANAVLVHFTKKEAKAAIRKVFDSLSDGGVFAVSVKHKENHESEWVDKDVGKKRFFTYWDKGEFVGFLEEVGYRVLSVEQRGGARSCWIKIVAQKPKMETRK